MGTAQPSPARITLPHLALLLPWVVAVIAAFDTVTDNSFLWHVTAGSLQAGRGEVLTTDPFSFTVAGEPWLTQSWLAELVYDLGHRTMGIGFVGPMLLVLSLIAFIGVGVIAYRRSSSILGAAVVVLLSVILLAPFLVPRPVVFSFPLFTLVILAWDRPGTRWTIPFLMWLWASTHGSFAIGLAYLGLMVISRRERRSWPHLVVAGAATLVTAHGVGVVTMLLDFADAGPYLALLSEWRTPSFVTPTLLPFLIGILLLINGAMRRRIGTQELWLIGPFLALGMTATRAVPIAWIALVPLVAHSLKGVTWNRGGGFPKPIAALLAALIVILPLFLVTPVVVDPERFPTSAVDSLAPTRTFHDDVTGGYLIYRQALPDGVFIDDRAELYRERIAELTDIREGRQAWQEVFERDGIEQALLRVGEPLAEWLTEAGWRATYRDPSFVVLVPA